MKIELNGKQIRVLYIILIVLGLFFILANCPLLFGNLTNPVPVARPTPIRMFIGHQLDLKAEGVLATWYSSMILFIAGGVALLNIRSDLFSGWLKWLNRAGWLLIGLVLVGLSADEVAQVHESLAYLLNSINEGARRREGAGDWIPILLPFIVGVALMMILFFGTVLRRHWPSLVLALAGVVSWIGAILSESIEAGFWQPEMSYEMRGFIEESFELIGTTCLLIAFVEFQRMKPPTSGATDSTSSPST